MTEQQAKPSDQIIYKSMGTHIATVISVNRSWPFGKNSSEGSVYYLCERHGQKFGIAAHRVIRVIARVS